MSKPPPALMTRFRRRLVEDLDFLRRQGAEGPRSRLVVHRLAGMAGMYGFPQLSRLAGVVDAQSRQGAVQGDDVAALMEALEAAVVRPG